MGVKGHVSKSQNYKEKPVGLQTVFALFILNSSLCQTHFNNKISDVFYLNTFDSINNKKQCQSITQLFKLIRDELCMTMSCGL